MGNAATMSEKQQELSKKIQRKRVVPTLVSAAMPAESNAFQKAASEDGLKLVGPCPTGKAFLTVLKGIRNAQDIPAHIDPSKDGFIDPFDLPQPDHPPEESDDDEVIHMGSKEDPPAEEVSPAAKPTAEDTEPAVEDGSIAGEKDEDACEICHGVEDHAVGLVLMQCITNAYGVRCCNKWWHPECVSLDEPPDGDWICQGCAMTQLEHLGVTEVSLCGIEMEDEQDTTVKNGENETPEPDLTSKSNTPKSTVDVEVPNKGETHKKQAPKVNCETPKKKASTKKATTKKASTKKATTKKAAKKKGSGEGSKSDAPPKQKAPTKNADGETPTVKEPHPPTDEEPHPPTDEEPHPPTDEEPHPPTEEESTDDDFSDTDDSDEEDYQKPKKNGRKSSRSRKRGSRKRGSRKRQSGGSGKRISGNGRRKSQKPHDDSSEDEESPKRRHKNSRHKFHRDDSSDSDSCEQRKSKSRRKAYMDDSSKSRRRSNRDDSSDSDSYEERKSKSHYKSYYQPEEDDGLFDDLDSDEMQGDSDDEGRAWHARGAGKCAKSARQQLDAPVRRTMQSTRRSMEQLQKQSLPFSRSDAYDPDDEGLAELAATEEHYPWVVFGTFCMTTMSPNGDGTTSAKHLRSPELHMFVGSTPAAMWMREQFLEAKNADAGELTFKPKLHTSWKTYNDAFRSESGKKKRPPPQSKKSKVKIHRYN